LPSQPELWTFAGRAPSRSRRRLAFFQRYAFRAEQIISDRPADAGRAVGRIHRDGDALIVKDVEYLAELAPLVRFCFKPKFCQFGTIRFSRTN
jgi:hypothetical protein